MAALKRDAVTVIAEVKRSSPSRGQLAAIADPAALAVEYEAGGAAAISVLTEERRFGGSLEDLDAVRKAVEIPLLRKDFIYTSYQLWEAVAYGADLVLLIVAALDQSALVSLVERAGSLGLTPLVEVHDEAELHQALSSGAEIVGVNNRNLRTFEVTLDVSLNLARWMPPGVIAVAESGIHSRADVSLLQKAGYRGFLVGEHLMKSPDPAAALRELTACS